MVRRGYQAVPCHLLILTVTPIEQLCHNWCCRMVGVAARRSIEQIEKTSTIRPCKISPV